MRKPLHGMKVTCSQPWEEMEPLGRDRFCAICAKPVIDFTERSDAELKAWFSDSPDGCGRFRIEQVQGDLMPLNEVPRELLRGAMAVLAALTLSTAAAQPIPVTPVPTEQAPGGAGGGSRMRPTEMAPSADRCWMEKDGAVPAPPRRRARYQVSSRFPFIHRARTVRGRVIGCPSF